MPTSSNVSQHIPGIRTRASRIGRTVAVGALAAVAGASLAACGARSGETTTASHSCVDTSGDTIKVGSLHSLSGTMAISEKTVRDSTALAIDQINAQGGVMGKKIEAVVEDGASDPAVFAEKAEKLISTDCVAAIFGGWTSSSRKAILPAVEDANSLLYYPVQYEGLEASPNIFYTGATTNQQIVPALEYLKEQGKKSLYLVGSDYVFPQTANRVIKAWAAANDVKILGETYTPLGSTDFSTIVNQIRSAKPDAVFNTLNGDSNVAFFREYTNSGLTADTMPVISVSIAEEEVGGIGAANITGQLTSWNYYQTVKSPENDAFVKAFKAANGANRPTSDPMEAAYTSVFLWKNTVEKAQSFDTDKVRAAADGVSFDAPEGTVTIVGKNQHVTKTARIGQIGDDGLIHTVWESDGPIDPDPFLESYDWAGELHNG